MREIKFRLWSENLKVMFSNTDLCLIENSNRNSMTGLNLLGVESSSSLNCKIIWGKRELMQYTGLKDKNGKEIYEGDVWERRGYKSQIVFEWSAWQIRTIKSSDSIQYPSFQSNAVTGEVIGNIYENPELLNK